MVNKNKPLTAACDERVSVANVTGDRARSQIKHPKTGSRFDLAKEIKQ